MAGSFFAKFHGLPSRLAHNAVREIDFLATFMNSRVCADAESSLSPAKTLFFESTDNQPLNEAWPVDLPSLADDCQISVYTAPFIGVAAGNSAAQSMPRCIHRFRANVRRNKKSFMFLFIDGSNQLGLERVFVRSHYPEAGNGDMKTFASRAAQVLRSMKLPLAWKTGSKDCTIVSAVENVSLFFLFTWDMKLHEDAAKCVDHCARNMPSLAADWTGEARSTVVRGEHAYKCLERIAARRVARAQERGGDSPWSVTETE